MKVAVVQGGLSSEAEVSRRSGAQLAMALTQAGHAVNSFELDAELAGKLLSFAPDVVFPIAHGTLGEDGCLQGLLEILRIPYVGSDVTASAVAADKSLTKSRLRAGGLPVARERLLERSLGAELKSEAAGELFWQLRREVGADLIVKPNVGGSTIGMTRLFSEAAVEPTASLQDFQQALASAFYYADSVLVEGYFRGIELTCGVLQGSAGPKALPPTLIQAETSDWYDFQAKYMAGGSSHQCPAPLPDKQLEYLQHLALNAHQLVGARDLSRTDFILAPDGELIILELNTLPGMTATSLFPEAALVAGIPFSSLADALVHTAFARGVRQLRAGVALSD